MKVLIHYLTIVCTLFVALPLHATVKEYVTARVTCKIADYMPQEEVAGIKSAQYFFDRQLIPLRIAIKNTGSSDLVVSRYSICQPSKKLVSALCALDPIHQMLLAVGWSGSLVACIRIIEESCVHSYARVTRYYPITIIASLSSIYLAWVAYELSLKHNAAIDRTLQENFLYRQHIIKPHDFFETIIIIDKNDLWKPIVLRIHDGDGNLVAAFNIPIEYKYERYPFQYSGGLKT